MNIGIIGLGLMGGSFGRMLVKKGEHKVFGLDNNENTMLKAEMLKAINERLNRENAKELDMLILALTPDKIEGVLSEYVPLLKSGAVITDFCGIKRKVCGLFRNLSTKYNNLVFIGGHPMAGREFSGIEHSSINLFENASMILVNINADIFKLDQVKKFYLSCGFTNVEICHDTLHDNRIAYTSQLAHVVSNAYIKNANAENHDGFSAGSYKDLTRVARLNPDMWADLMIENADNLSKELTELIDNLNQYKKALDGRDKENLRSLLKEGNDRKLTIDCKSGK